MEKMGKSEAAEKIADILVQFPASSEDTILCLVEDVVRRRRQRLAMVRMWRRTRQAGETWAAFVAEAVEIGEWEAEWGTPEEPKV